MPLSSSNVFLSDAQIQTALRLSACLKKHRNDLDEFSECVGFALIRDPALAPGQGLHACIDGDNFIIVGKSEPREEMLTCLHELFHLLHSPLCIVPDMQHVQVVREESKANAFAALAFYPRMRRHETQQEVYTIFGPHHRDVAYARIVHEARHPSWI